MENFCEAFKVDDDLSFDETHKLFRYTYEGHQEILPVKNIIFCAVTADINSLNKNLIHYKKYFSPQSEEAYELSQKINGLTE